MSNKEIDIEIDDNIESDSDDIQSSDSDSDDESIEEISEIDNTEIENDEDNNIFNQIIIKLIIAALSAFLRESISTPGRMNALTENLSNLKSNRHIHKYNYKCQFCLLSFFQRKFFFERNQD